MATEHWLENSTIKLKEWVNSSALVLSKSVLSLDSCHIHIDELISPEVYERRESCINNVMLLFERVSSDYHHLMVELDYVFCLVIPLEASVCLNSDIPFNIQQILNEQDIIEPPSFYLYSKNNRKHMYTGEQYVYPLNFILGNSYFSYYRTWRDQDSIINSWEYSRAIYIEYPLSDM